MNLLITKNLRSVRHISELVRLSGGRLRVKLAIPEFCLFGLDPPTPNQRRAPHSQFSWTAFPPAGQLSHHGVEGHPRLVFLHHGSQVGPVWTEQQAQQRQPDPHQQPEQQEGERHRDLHEVEDGGAELTQDARQEEGPQSHAGVEGQLSQHEDVLAAAVPHVRVEALPLGVERRHPDSQLENPGKEDNHTADLDGLQLVVGVVWKLVG